MLTLKCCCGERLAHSANHMRKALPVMHIQLPKAAYNDDKAMLLRGYASLW